MLNENPQEFSNELVAKANELFVNYYHVLPKHGHAGYVLGIHASDCLVGTVKSKEKKPKTNPVTKNSQF